MASTAVESSIETLSDVRSTRTRSTIMYKLAVICPYCRAGSLSFSALGVHIKVYCHKLLTEQDKTKALLKFNMLYPTYKDFERDLITEQDFRQDFNIVFSKI